MDRNQMLFRFGWYVGFANLHLKDPSIRAIAAKYLGRAEDITEEVYWRETAEIHRRLVEAGVITADEDPFERRAG